MIVNNGLSRHLSRHCVAINIFETGEGFEPSFSTPITDNNLEKCLGYPAMYFCSVFANSELSHIAIRDISTPREIRTLNLSVRSRVLYPVKL